MSSRASLDAPLEQVVAISEAHAQSALEASRASERLRVILPFHKNHQDPLHRMFNAMQPGTYVQPHRHLTLPKAEVFLVLRGAIDFLVFDERGRISDLLTLEAGGEAFGVDLAPGLYHSFLVRVPDTLLYEVKLGPYTGTNDKDFAPWAPAEGSAEVADYVARLEADVALRRAAPRR